MDWQVYNHRVTITRERSPHTTYAVSDYETGRHIGLVTKWEVDGCWHIDDRVDMQSIAEATRREAVELLVMNHYAEADMARERELLSRREQGAGS